MSALLEFEIQNTTVHFFVFKFMNSSLVVNSQICLLTQQNVNTTNIFTNDTPRVLDAVSIQDILSRYAKKQKPFI